MSVLEVDLNQFIPPAYDQLFDDLKGHKFVHYVLFGGRGGGKSTFASDEVVTTLMTEGSVIEIKRYKNSLRRSVFQAVINSIAKLGVEAFFKVSQTALEITHIPTGRKAFYGGLDDPTKLKSFEAPTEDGFALIVFEECQEIEDEEKVRSVVQTFARKGRHTNILYLNNPPRSPRNWVNATLNKVTEKDNGRKQAYHINFTDIPREWGWLSDVFYDEAEHLRITNPRAYDNEFLGLAVAGAGAIFNNVMTPKPDMVFDFSRVYRGLDLGYTKDPTAYMVVGYERHSHSIYLRWEVYGHHMKHRELAPQMIAENPEGYLIISEHDQRAIDELADLGVRGLIKAKKGPGSVNAGTKWLEGLNAIYIDPVNCPNAYREFTEYAYPTNRNGIGVKDGVYPDKDNHTIDAVRYALEDVQLGYVY